MKHIETQTYRVIIHEFDGDRVPVTITVTAEEAAIPFRITDLARQWALDHGYDVEAVGGRERLS